MATIRPIEGRSVHQIQSGQVIVDLCSVVKELVENSLDAGATSIEVRFKGNGLDSIEVQDNGNGISTENYETVALKHHTSKLSSFDDLGSLQTFGFRGEALSSLCALSNFHILTAQAHEAPKGSRLDFETSGKLQATSVVASQKGTTVIVEALFANLPVRRRELEKNCKREYTKVLGVLQAYACISVSVKFSVSNVLAKGKKVIVFATKSNTATRENIANVFGAKTLTALVLMDLRFDLHDNRTIHSTAGKMGSEVRVLGHVSRPVIGDGRQTPDRQMFFVNARPCTLPQFAKVFNEVYKSYNVSQSPFVFANIIIDTNAYDVNVSPDKKTILLHEQSALLESLRIALVELFEQQDQTVPQSQRPNSKLPVFKPLTVQPQLLALHVPNLPNKSANRKESSSVSSDEGRDDDHSEDSDHESRQSTGIIGRFAGRDAQPRNSKTGKDRPRPSKPTTSMGKQEPLRQLEASHRLSAEGHDHSNEYPAAPHVPQEIQTCPLDPLVDSDTPIPQQQGSSDEQETGPCERPHLLGSAEEHPITAVRSTPTKSASGPVQNAFDRMRPRREPPQVATITIGEKTTTTVIGATSSSSSTYSPVNPTIRPAGEEGPKASFSSSMRAFTAPGASLLEASSHQNPSPTNRKPNKAVITTNQASGDESSPAENPLGDESILDDAHSSSGNESLGSETNDEMLSAGESDEEYEDDQDRRMKQDAKVADLIEKAEAKLAAPSDDDVRRAGKILKGRTVKDSTMQLLQTLHVSVNRIEEKVRNFEKGLRDTLEKPPATGQMSHLAEEEQDAEQKLSLKVAKTDFSRMKIIGQFNLGFIITTRPSTSSTTDDELFIIDQHASDEKYNFERLQASTTVQSQRLVRPKVLDLTAIDEEIIIENHAALLENGFVVDVDQTGDAPVGQRCKVLSLPMSREVTFDLSDLEELISLLGESPPSLSIANTDTPGQGLPSRHIPRPSKIRKLFAMRACRSSVMIGKTLQKRQMEKLVRHMGEIDKPWNCPHGRPTMRHLLGLKSWEGWKEGDGLVEDYADVGEEVAVGNTIDWGLWLAEKNDVEHAERGSDDEENESSDHEVDSGSQSEGDIDLHGNEEHLEIGGDDATTQFDDDRDEIQSTNDERDADKSDGSNEEMEESGNEEDGLANARQSISQRFTFS
ncbi:MAG: hypothetical protein Q9168_003001 [Polycauliona sp. 1 TL-2023]